MFDFIFDKIFPMDWLKGLATELFSVDQFNGVIDILKFDPNNGLWQTLYKYYNIFKPFAIYLAVVLTVVHIVNNFSEDPEGDYSTLLNPFIRLMVAIIMIDKGFEILGYIYSFSMYLVNRIHVLVGQISSNDGIADAVWNDILHTYADNKGHIGLAKRIFLTVNIKMAGFLLFIPNLLIQGAVCYKLATVFVKIAAAPIALMDTYGRMSLTDTKSVKFLKGLLADAISLMFFVVVIAVVANIVAMNFAAGQSLMAVTLKYVSLLLIAVFVMFTSDYVFKNTLG